MAFCRFGADDSDVYCFYNVNGFYEVWANQEWSYKTAKGAIKRLLRLKAEGLIVPQYAIDELEKENCRCTR